MVRGSAAWPAVVEEAGAPAARRNSRGFRTAASADPSFENAQSADSALDGNCRLAQSSSVRNC
jgi:hypothetical protein